jgi:YbbR domain-containing protein
MLDRLLSNWPLKLLALALAFAIWVSVTGENQVVQDVSVPLDLRLSDDRVAASATPTTVTARLRGGESLMRRLDPVPLAVRVDLRGAPLGDQEVQIATTDLVNVPRGVEVEFIDPDRFPLTVDRRLRRDLEIEVTFLSSPPEGYHFYGAEVRPRSVVVEGPESELKQTAVIRTNPIRLDQRTEPFRERVSAVPEGTYVRLVDPRPLEVRVEVDVAPVERTLEGIPVEVAGASDGASVSPAVLDVTISGPPALVGRIRPDQVRVIADAGELESSSQAQRVDVRVEFANIPARDLPRIAAKGVSRRQVSVRAADEDRE